MFNKFLKKKKGNLYSFAESELSNVLSEDVCDQEFKKDILMLIECFSKIGSSGGLTSLIIDTFTKLALYKPLTKIYGNDDEWGEVAENLYQNKRRSTVFKTIKNKCYDIDFYVGEDEDGFFHSWWCREQISFPYKPQAPIKVYRGSMLHWWLEVGRFKFNVCDLESING